MAMPIAMLLNIQTTSAFQTNNQSNKSTNDKTKNLLQYNLQNLYQF